MYGVRTISKTLCILTLFVTAMVASVPARIGMIEVKTSSANAPLPATADVAAENRNSVPAISKRLAPSPLLLSSRVQQAANAKGCDQSVSETPDLSGEYNAVLFTVPGDDGIPVRFKIKKTSFELIWTNAYGDLGKLAGDGSITAVNTCGVTAVALRFRTLDGELAEGVGQWQSVVSLSARHIGTPLASKTMVTTLATETPLVLSTVHDASGRLAGADIAILVCPRYPDCLKYPKCPCPTPD